MLGGIQTKGIRVLYRGYLIQKRRQAELLRKPFRKVACLRDYSEFYEPWDLQY